MSLQYIAVDSQGIVYILDPHDGCIQNISTFRHLIAIEKFGIWGFKEGELALPYGITMDNKDYVHISEAPLQRISICMNGRGFVQCFLACDEDKGSDDKEKCAPELWDLAVDKNETLFANYTKNRISSDISYS